jgi:GMP synthase (glutamine-hydrolysing)
MDTVVILDFGGQYTHLIGRRVRDLCVYSEILPSNVELKKIKKFAPKAIILSGGPSSIYSKNSPKLSGDIFNYIQENNIPLLGICYGLHLIIHHYGGIIEPREKQEYGKTILKIIKPNKLFETLKDEEIVWMSHLDQVIALPSGFHILGSTKNCPIAAFGHDKFSIYGVQFHPEVKHTINGEKILSNFLFKIARCKKEWILEDWIKTTINEIKEKVGENRVILGLSGGVDSSVTALLLEKAIGERVHCLFVNNNLLRKNEEVEIQEFFKKKLNFSNFHYIDAKNLFMKRLKGISNPEEKRKIIAKTFIEVFEEKIKDLESEYPNIKFLAQGTIYPDRVESKATSKFSSKIKSHHNVILPEKLNFDLIEPLKDLYKDEVRKIGLKLGLPEEILKRHPFPGPGLAVRIIGPTDEEKLDMIREADQIIQEEIRNAGIYDDLWQIFPVFLPVKSVGVMGDHRTYEYICVIRAVQSIDAMTANFAKIDWDLLGRISTRIINEVKGFNRVLYDISNKPPSTIEYE